MSLADGDNLGPTRVFQPSVLVYRVRDTRLDRIVGIKVSKTEFSERFECEARAVAALNHPHIYQIRRRAESLMMESSRVLR